MEARHRETKVAIVTDPKKSANSAGLRYVSDHSPGIRRVTKGKNFQYLSANGKAIHDDATLRRIRSLAIPPAWQDVWICPQPDGHLQAVGRDNRGRKQYRYHPRWRATRDDTKFTRLIVFAEALPRIRRQLEKDLPLSGLPRAKALAAIVRLLDLCHIRVGNEEYARQNKSFGLTTLRNHHAKVRGASIRFQFKGKSAKKHDIEVEDGQLAKIVKHCQDLPGQDLFQYIDENGNDQDVKSEHVNDYLREASGQDFTAKDFRTWAGTVWAMRELCRCARGETQKELKKAMAHAVETVAAKLGNTPAVCRKCYVHPAIFEAYQKHATPRLKTGHTRLVPLNGLSSEEKCVLNLLKRQLADQHEPLQAKLQRSLLHQHQKKSAKSFTATP